MEDGSEKCDCIDTVKTRLVHGNNKFACRTKGKHKHPAGSSVNFAFCEEIKKILTVFLWWFMRKYFEVQINNLQHFLYRDKILLTFLIVLSVILSRLIFLRFFRLVTGERGRLLCLHFRNFYLSLGLKSTCNDWNLKFRK